MNYATSITTIDEVILRALSSYVQGRAEEIVAKHTNEAIAEIEKAVRDEVSKTVLNVGQMVNFKNGPKNELIITVLDKREAK